LKLYSYNIRNIKAPVFRGLFLFANRLLTII